ncbi:MAG TPA: hypothetical protein DEF27_03040 [Oscillatoriales bacterium UBA8482]|nr:hypothetical protein [Oscillatoriales bacterium UBA8482]
MVEIRIYVEGGGDGQKTKNTFRIGMSQFLQRLTGRSVICVVCVSRNDACRNFKNALKSHPDAINLLLVDSEGLVNTLTIDPNADPEEKDRVMGLSARQHLINRDPWEGYLSGIDEHDIHLMVQFMESWLIADIDTLAQIYGQGFNKTAIPRNNNVEEIPKDTIESALNRATERTQKGRYQKIYHAAKILEIIDVSIVRKKAPYCDRLFRRITDS